MQQFSSQVQEVAKRMSGAIELKVYSKLIEMTIEVAFAIFRRPVTNDDRTPGSGLFVLGLLARLAAGRPCDYEW